VVGSLTCGGGARGGEGRGGRREGGRGRGVVAPATARGGGDVDGVEQVSGHEGEGTGPRGGDQEGRRRSGDGAARRRPRRTAAVR
jgi:hypothetical protein